MYKFINREQLYNQIWSVPMTRLAPQYKLSTYELKKYVITSKYLHLGQGIGLNCLLEKRLKILLYRHLISAFPAI
jgi:hypothetical protein